MPVNKHYETSCVCDADPSTIPNSTSSCSVDALTFEFEQVDSRLDIGEGESVLRVGAYAAQADVAAKERRRMVRHTLGIRLDHVVSKPYAACRTGAMEY